MIIETIDVQDDKAFWNDLSVIRSDTGYLPLKYDVTKDSMVDHLYQWFIKNKIKSNPRVLEAGCGGGRLTMIWDTFSKRYNIPLQYLAIDHANSAVELARERNPNIEFRVSGIEDFKLEEKEEKFDIIFTHTVLQHNSEWKQLDIYKNCKSLLKSNGILYLINEKTFSSWEDGIFLDPFYQDSRGSHGTAAVWINRICGFGFELIEYYKSQYTFKTLGE